MPIFADSVIYQTTEHKVEIKESTIVSLYRRPPKFVPVWITDDLQVLELYRGEYKLGILIDQSSSKYLEGTKRSVLYALDNSLIDLKSGASQMVTKYRLLLPKLKQDVTTENLDIPYYYEMYSHLDEKPFFLTDDDINSLREFKPFIDMVREGVILTLEWLGLNSDLSVNNKKKYQTNLISGGPYVHCFIIQILSFLRSMSHPSLSNILSPFKSLIRQLLASDNEFIPEIHEALLTEINKH